MDNSDLGVSPKIVEVRVAISSLIFAGMGQTKSHLACTQRVNVDVVVI